jgi:alkylation response protein AidB-like acyl-CoA dehydrogenase
VISLQPPTDALRLEKALGDPRLADNTISFKRAVELDEADAFPEDAISLLQRIGLPVAYVPEELGGCFRSAETFMAIGRTLARRNMTAAVSYSTMLWTMLAWIGGNQAQKTKIADWIAKNGRFPCLAYSEADHGADLSANELRAERGADGRYLLQGEKWPINRATRSEFLVLLARTDASDHLRSHSLFFVDKTELESRRYYHLPRVLTHGLRGCDISGIGFDACPIPATAMVGEQGHGLELALKGFQVTRTFCASLSLGVGDTALRTVYEFADGRRLYGKRALDLPHVRDILANAYASQLAAEAMSIVAARGLHLFPEQFSSWSSIAKVQVTHLVDESCRKLATVLGARHFMRERHVEGIFQKMLRDGAVVSLFDGSTPVCLDSLATMLPAMVKSRHLHVQSRHHRDEIYDLSGSLPAIDFSKFKLYGGGRDAIFESLPELMRELGRVVADEHCDQDRLDRLISASEILLNSVHELDDDILAEPALRGERNSARKFKLAERYCELHAAICSIGLWLYNRKSLPGFFSSGIWLQAILVRLGGADPKNSQLEPVLTDKLIDRMQDQFNQNLMFSLQEWPLAISGSKQSPHPLFTEEAKNEHQFA